MTFSFHTHPNPPEYLGRGRVGARVMIDRPQVRVSSGFLSSCPPDPVWGTLCLDNSSQMESVALRERGGKGAAGGFLGTDV